MFIVIIGTKAAGKSEIKEYLLRRKGFREVKLVHDSFKEKATPASPDARSVNGLSYGHGGSHSVSSIDSAAVLADRLADTRITSPAQVLSSHLDIHHEQSQEEGELVFEEPSHLLHYITRNWRERFVTVDITTREVLEPFLRRPFALLVSVDAPMLVRYRRSTRSGQTTSLEDFVAEDDQVTYGSSSRSVTTSYLFASLHLCHVNVINSYDTIPDLYQHLDSVDLLNNDRLRPGWDSYFMKLASLASHRSNCMKRRVGAILVRDHAIIATGYNGTPRGIPNCNEGGCKRCNIPGPSPIDGFEECLCIHAEENALLEAGRERVGKGAIMYCNTCPCLKCTIKIVQTGVAEVVYNLSYKMDASAASVFAKAGVKLRQYSPPKLSS